MWYDLCAKDWWFKFFPLCFLCLQVLIVSCTAFAGVLSLNYQREYTVWVLPLIIVCVFAFLVAHCFLSIYESVVDVLFLCFAIDTKYNDGSPGREYYMDKTLMVRALPDSFPQTSRSIKPKQKSFIIALCCCIAD